MEEINISIEKKKIIDNFCHRFLKDGVKPKSFSDILDLSPNSFKEILPEEVEKLEKGKFKSIRDISKINYKDLEKIAEKIELDINSLRKWVLAANLVGRAWQKRASYLKKEDVKIAVLGLDSAGKTSMLETLSGVSSLGQIVDLEPTTGVDVRKMQSDNMNLSILDFGGQVGHRHDYLQNPEEYFLQIDLVIFVVDMQNPDRFDESNEYFSQLLEIISFLKEHPYFLILLHKSDPELLDDPDYQINSQYIQDLFSNKLQTKGLSYEILPTSIYNYYATEPEFATTFKKFFGKKDSKQKGVEGLITDLSELLLKVSTNIIEEVKSLKLAIATSGQLNSIEKNAVKNLEPSILSPTTPPIPRNQFTPPPPPPPQQVPSGSVKSKATADLRTNLMVELREMFKIRKLAEE